MKKLIIIATLMGSAQVLNAQPMASGKVSIVPSSIHSVINLLAHPSSEKKLQLIVTDHGPSTDVSPRYSVYLGFATLTEMSHITADFKITDQPISVLGARRLSAGHYELKALELGSKGDLVSAIYAIDATQLFLDERAAQKSCGEFCDLELQTKISVTRTEAAGPKH